MNIIANKPDFVTSFGQIQTGAGETTTADGLASPLQECVQETIPEDMPKKNVVPTKAKQAEKPKAAKTVRGPTPAIDVAEVTRRGRRHESIIATEPTKRAKLDFGGALDIVTVEKDATSYTISADLPAKLKACLNCGSTDRLALHGRYVVRMTDLPYVDADQRAMPVIYKLSVQRYQCRECGRGDVEPPPEPLRPIVTDAKITRRLSEWMIYVIQTPMTYETIARLTAYSKVWVRKWCSEVRDTLSLPPKLYRPGPKRSSE